MTTLAMQTEAQVVGLTTLCDENYRLRLSCAELAQQILPGQFFMLRKPDCSDPLLGRPFALYDTVQDETGQTIGVDVGFHVVGKMTGIMEELTPGDTLELWGPLGNGFPTVQADHLIQVAGGIGYTPFVATSREVLMQKKYGTEINRQRIQAGKASLIYGVREKRFCADMSDLSDIKGLDIQLCTEDGTAGHHGLVTDLLLAILTENSGESKIVFTCGPIRMMQAVALLCANHNTECWVSLETPMACGFGACFSCVVPTKQAEDDEWDYRRSCLEGPVFPGRDILWEQM